MSTYLWKYYLENDVDSFRRLLAAAHYSAAGHSKAHTAGGNIGLSVGSPGKALSASPNLRSKSRGNLEWDAPARGTKGAGGVTLTRADINSQDAHAVTLLHHIASSTTENAPLFAQALLDLPMLDLYAQDLESGWTALHRALYSGNITIARALMDRDYQDTFGHGNVGGTHVIGGIIKIKDREGNSPFDVYGLSITNRIIRQDAGRATLSAGTEEDEEEIAEGISGDNNGDMSSSRLVTPQVCIDGDEMFMLGSNKNLTLGFGDEDDRQFPERITLKRPEHLLRRLHAEHQVNSKSHRRSIGSPTKEKLNLISPSDLPALVQYSELKIQDVQLSKLHSAVLTTDPEANLYMCGVGQGGRLGTGDETTRFNFACIYGGGLLDKKVVNVGLGQNHSIAISSQGEVFTWGNNAFGQLGYAIASSNVKQEDPLQLLPRQIFGPLKREVCVGSAASRLHSVVFTKASLYTFGKNEGQLGLVDSDARSLEIQVVPRKVAASLFSSPINMVSAIDKATICLLENHDVWIFANYGYTRMSFPLDGFSNRSLSSSHFSTRHDSTPNHITKISSGGDTICAMAKTGDVFTVTVSQKLDSSPVTSSTTNPAKIRGALSAPRRVWSLRKGHMAVRDVDVGQDGSVIICTEAGSVWKRVKRAKIKDASGSTGPADYKPKDYKFSRIPGLTRITAVRSNAFGAFAAVRTDTEVLKIQTSVTEHTLWKDVFPLLPFHGLSKQEDSDTEEPALRFWTPRQVSKDPATIRHAVLTSKDIEADVASLLSQIGTSEDSNYDIKVGSTLSDITIPCHEFMLAGRSKVLRTGLQHFREAYFFGLPDVFSIEYDKEGNALILFQGLDFLTILNLVFYVYTDSVIDVWHHTRRATELAFRYRQVRTELMKTAAQLELRVLEHAARVMNQPPRTLHEDMEAAVHQADYLETGDADIELDDGSITVHSALLCQRCPFFECLFHGRTGGSWLSSRRERLQESRETIKVDLKHVNVGTFGLVLQHLYADTGEKMFDKVVTEDLNSFLDLVLDVMSVANELMLDRLAQICQKILGQFVTTRNVCQLLNAVAPCSVTEFKDAALEYICLNLEGMLENQLLNDLDDDLILELDNVVRQNQLACLPFAKSGKAEARLLETYPELASLMERDKRVRIDSMALQSRLHEAERRTASSRNKIETSSDTRAPMSPVISGRISSEKIPSAQGSPYLVPKKSMGDMMFDLDDEYGQKLRTTSLDESAWQRASSFARSSEMEDQESPAAPSLPREEPWLRNNGRAIPSTSSAQISTPLIGSPSPASYTNQPQSRSKDIVAEASHVQEERPWRAPDINLSKLAMKDIMAQAAANRQSNISAALLDQATNVESGKVIAGTKLSQRERKKQLQQQQQSVAPQSPVLPPTHPISPVEKASPWRTASAGAKISLKDVLQDKRDKSPSPALTKARISPGSSMTLRQTIPGNVSSKSAKPELPQQRSIPTPAISKPIPPSPIMPTRLSPQTRQSQPSPSNTIRSVRYTPPAVEPSLQLSMADILSQQQTEKDIIKEAATKRSLQEIQEEQAFQEWWDQEEAATRARLLEEEAAAKSSSGSGGRGGRSSRSGKGKDRGGSRGRGRGGRRGGGEGARKVSGGEGANAGT